MLSASISFVTYDLLHRFYCPNGSIQTDQEQCPAGSYCPQGTQSPTPCPEGTYSNTPELYNITQCTDCDPGQYCNDTGKTGCGTGNDKKLVC